jgi:hypothetical protein
MATELVNDADKIDALKNLLNAVLLARSLPFPVDLWKVQNLYWDMLQSVYPAFKQKAGQKDLPAVAWVKAFTSLGKNLSVRVE